MRKQLIFAVFFILTSATVFAQKGGSLVVEITSITCKNKSFDGLVEFDGPGNEVFVSGGYFTRNPGSNTFKIDKGVNTTSTYGSTAGHNERIKAGTASPDGGIDNNNTFTVGSILFATHLDGDGFTLFSPLLWERDDNNETIYNRYKTQLLSDLESASLMPFPNFGGSPDPGNPFSGKIYSYSNAYNIPIPPNSYPAIFYSLVNPNVQGNRPMQISKYAGQILQFDPKIVLIEAKNLWNAYNQTPVNHPYPLAQYPFKTIKEITLNFGEDTYAIETSNGKYTVNFAIKFAPDPDNAPAAPQPAQNTGITQVNTNAGIQSLGTKPVNTIKGNTPLPASYTMNTAFLTGQWKGISGANDNTKSSPFSFRINNNVFWLLDNTGGSVASGGFKIENNNFSSTYYYPNGDNYTISSANYNPSTGELSGSWTGNGANSNRRGNWLAVKASN
jgi:hypothetical protein